MASHELPQHEQDWKSPEIVLEEGTNAYFMPRFYDSVGDTEVKGLAKHLLKEGNPINTHPEVMRQRMNDFFKGITDQGGRIVGFKTLPAFNGLGETVGYHDFIVVDK